ncbi:hypothetical protein C7401_15057 [Paraburkholderia unamae]|uniref:hypothetical protein n=1 Tax=Paraburkholderia unamae TaxID=219649 RepID=UPI000DC35EBA|nr:hypothetical protein [Paraburkholderia unamae]RAR48696.1 hypothetical protein C7401_15057 [Paraburkholderia unamae]
MTSAPPSPQPAGASRRPVPTRAQRAAVWLGLCAVPLVWLLHLALGVTLLSSACTDAVAQNAAPTWRGMLSFLAIASACAFLIALAIAYAAGRAWRKIVYASHEKHDTHRFVAWCGATTSVAFTFGLAFSICILIAVPIERLCVAFG